MKIRFQLNGRSIEGDFEAGRTLMDVLRENGIFSVKYGCDHGECGACTVLLDGQAYNACLVLMHTVNGRNVMTVEALESHGRLHPLQKQFLDEGAIQCGYCTPGMLLSLQALVREGTQPSEGEIRDTLAGNLCRCTGYVKPVAAAGKWIQHDDDPTGHR